MFESIRKYFQERALRKNASAVPTGLLPLSEIGSMTVLLDWEKREFDECKNDLAYFCRLHGIRLKMFFFNFQKIESDERLITSVSNTVLRRDLTWRGTFKEEKNHLLFANPSDILIVLAEYSDFPTEYFVKCSRARFKVGRTQLPGQPYDLILSNPEGKECSQTEVFKAVKDILLKIS